MKIISWNCRDLGNPRAVPALKDLIRSQRPDVVVLIETLQAVRRIEEVRVQVGFECCFSVDCRGGGVAILWRTLVNVSVTSYSQNFVNLDIIDDSKGVWRLTAFYGFPERSRRRSSWDLIRSLAAMSPIPWCIVGDFNNIIFDDDKRGGSPYPNWLKNGFRSAINDCGLLEGHPFTWAKLHGSLAG